MSKARFAYALRVDLQTQGRPLDERRLSPKEYERQYRAAMAEIDANDALSFTYPHEKTGDRIRAVWLIRCGASLGGARFCTQQRGHDDACDAEWPETKAEKAATAARQQKGKRA